MQRICATLTEHGYDVTLVGRKLKSSGEPSFTFKTKRLNCWFNKGKAFYVELNLRLFFYLLVTKFDAACAVDLDTALPVWASTMLKAKVFAFDAHEYFQEVPEVINRKRVKHFWERVAKFIIPKTDFRYTVSSGLASQFRALYGVAFSVVRNLPKYEKHNSKANNSLFILYQGALNKGRGLEALIKAAPYLPISVKIAGEGDLSAELRALANKLNLNDKVEFLGYLKPAELRSLTPTAFLGYNLLENSGLSYYYSLANKFFDYTMAGVPGLVPPFPEYELLNEKYAIGITTDLNENEIISTVKDLVADKERYQRLVDNALEAAKDLNWENEQKVLLDLYSQHLPSVS